MKKLFLIFVIGLFITSCGRKVNCEQFPQTFIENYIPYTENQNVVFANEDGETINFVVTETYFWESYKYTIPYMTDCSEDCEPIYVTMVDTEKNIVLRYEMQAHDKMMTISISGLYTQIEVALKDFDLPNITFVSGPNQPGFFYCCVEKGKGITVLHERKDNSQVVEWNLVEPEKEHEIKYIPAKSKGC